MAASGEKSQRAGECSAPGSGLKRVAESPAVLAAFCPLDLISSLTEPSPAKQQSGLGFVASQVHVGVGGVCVELRLLLPSLLSLPWLLLPQELRFAP